MQLLLFYPSLVIGVAALLVFAVRWAAVSADRDRAEKLLVTGIFVVFIGNAAEIVAKSLSSIRPLKYDLYVYRLDALLGFQPSFVLARFFLPHYWAALTLTLVYGLLGTAVLALCSWYIWERHPWTRRVLIAFALNLACAPAIYFLFPVCGPQFAFPHFPADPGLVLPHLIPLADAPNGVPSVHCSTAILIWWFSRRNRWVTLATIIYLILVILSTLVSGQHYLFDLIVAVPYAAVVVWLTDKAVHRLAKLAPPSHRVGESTISPSAA
jgi:hypothetical protein